MSEDHEYIDPTFESATERDRRQRREALAAERTAAGDATVPPVPADDTDTFIPPGYDDDLYADSYVYHDDSPVAESVPESDVEPKPETDVALAEQENDPAAPESALAVIEPPEAAVVLPESSDDSPPPPRKRRTESGDHDDDFSRTAGDFMDHLEELRIRILRSLVYATLGACLAWYLYDRQIVSFIPSIWDLLLNPVQKHLSADKIPTVFQNPVEPIMIRCLVSCIAGAIIASPLIFYEVWAFVWPGLLANERKYLRPLIPSSFVLFWTGVGLAYWVVPRVFAFLLSYAPHNSQVFNFVRWYIPFLAKVCLSMGIVFQMPIIFWLLGKLGLVTSRFLLNVWRHAIIVILLIAAIVTPTPDPFNMMLVASPIIALYFVSILLVKLTERERATVGR